MQHGVHIFHRADTSAHRERHETTLGCAADDIDHGSAPMGAGGDVEEDHLIGALFIVANGEFHRVSDFPQASLLGATKLNSAGHFPVVNVETGNDTFCEHLQVLVDDFSHLHRKIAANCNSLHA